LRGIFRLPARYRVCYGFRVQVFGLIGIREARITTQEANRRAIMQGFVGAHLNE
jgi:hypothetical protein